MAAENEARKDEEGYHKHKISDGNTHPCVKPLDLMRYLVKMVKMPGDNLILDPFMGSGTTIVACELEGCGYVGIDMDEVSVKIAQHRVAYAEKHGEKGYG
jgi:site-specific DNA-methyltransferase (adenine-specific)